MPTRLLAIGDIHLGRMSRRLPEAVDPSELTPAAALRQAVQTARSQDVSAVLLAGDVADQDHDLYRALAILSEELAPLADAGIPIFAVAGNHDHKVLPRLEKALPALRLLGRGGTWETVTIDGPGGPVNLLGWSFPARRHASSPAVGLPPIDGEVPRGNVNLRDYPGVQHGKTLGEVLAVMVPTNVNYKAHDLAYILSDSDAGTIVIHEDYLPVLEKIRPNDEADGSSGW